MATITINGSVLTVTAPARRVLAVTPRVYLVNSSDTTPDAFSFTDVTSAALSTVYTSNTITVAGIDTDSAVSVSGGTYSVNGGAYTASAGAVVNGDTVAVRVTSSGSNSTAASAVLTIGGVSDTYTVTTAALGVGTAGQPIGLLLTLLKAA